MADFLPSSGVCSLVITEQSIISHIFLRSSVYTTSVLEKVLVVRVWYIKVILCGEYNVVLIIYLDCFLEWIVLLLFKCYSSL